MKKLTRVLIWIGCIAGTLFAKIILDVIAGSLFSIRLGYVFDIAALALGIKLAKSLAKKFELLYEKKRIDSKAKSFISDVPASITQKCESYKGNNHVLRNYLDVCLSQGTITQDQFNSLYHMYSTK